MGKLQIQGERLPITVAAGVAKTEKELELIAEDEVISIVVAGTYTWGHRVVLDRYMNWDEQAQIATNKWLFDNPGLMWGRDYLPRSIDRAHSVGLQVMLSLGVAPYEDPMKMLPKMAEVAVDLGADGVELNPQCTNMRGMFDFEREDKALELAGNVRDRIGPGPALFYKVPNMGKPLINGIARTRLSIDGVSEINTMRGISGPAKREIGRLNTIDWVEAGEMLGGPDNFQVISELGIPATFEGGVEAYDTVNVLGAFAVGLGQDPFRFKDDPETFHQRFMDMKDGWQAAAQAA